MYLSIEVIVAITWEARKIRMGMSNIVRRSVGFLSIISLVSQRPVIITVAR